MAKKLRHSTYFGVHIPPWREQKYGKGRGAGITTIRFVISGRVVSKKNNLQAVTIRKDARKWAKNEQKTGRKPTWDDVNYAIGLVYSKMWGNAEYKEFIEKYKPIIQEQMQEWSKRLAKNGLVFPIPACKMNLRLYFKDKYITDTVNKQQTIQDLLKECGVIPDDNYRCLNPISSASASYYQEIIDNISFISLSFKLNKPLH